ncbi:hypothetical protein JL720_16819 [Aureococcus anophagefferens]|nr:hypothetical protein JL720_16819 [Aureococcus anophagefferens]
MPEWESAIETALANKLEARAADREAKAKAAQKEIEEFTSEFLNARQFQMIDADNSGTLTKAEIVEAVQSNETVITFLRTCGEPNLVLAQPRRLQKAPRCSTRPRTARSTPRWEEAINRGLQEFLGAARHCFQLIDKDDSGTLTKTEIVKAVQTDPEVKGFLETCGEENLQFLLVPARLEKALQVLDTSKDGEVDVDEWEEAINRGLKVRLAKLAEERDRRERRGRGGRGVQFEFLSAAGSST